MLGQGRTSSRPVRFSWRNFCADYGIFFVTRGPNTARGHISIQCPWCGDADQSQHMGLSLEVNDPRWGCFRNADHRGRHPLRLVQQLLGCSREAAQQVIGAMAGVAAPQQPARKQKTKPAGPLLMPDTFRPLRLDGYGGKFVDYLCIRGFDDWEELARRYDLRYCLVDDFKWRLIFPVYMKQQLITWTGRTIQPAAQPRYKSLSDQEGQIGRPTALRNIKESIYNADSLQRGGDTLVVTEGPLDCLKVDFYAGANARATCLFGTAITEKQAQLLALYGGKFSRIDVLLDKDATTVAWKLVEEIRALVRGTAVRSRQLPPGIHDPGELTKDGVRDLYP